MFATISRCTLFTTSTREVCYSLALIVIDGFDVATTTHPRVFPVVFDNMLTFNVNMKSQASKVQSRNSVLKALAESTWEKDKETRQATYKG